MERVTIRDVAKAAGVSTTTVSRFLNGSGYVNAATSERIRDAVAQTGYAPSLLARSLKTRQSGILLLIVPDIANPFYAIMAKTLQALARQHGYTMLLWDSGGNAEDELSALEMAVSMSVEGVLFANIDSNGQINQFITTAPFYTVGLNAFAEGTPFDAVSVDIHGGISLAVEHLAQLGHTNIAYAGGYPDTYIGRSRRNGYLMGMAAHGLIVRPENDLEYGFSQEGGRAAGREFAARENCPTAICCGNDLVALGVIAALNEAGLRVPEDVSVTGMDDITYAALSSPPLTSVSNDPAAFADRGFAMLLDRLRGQNPPPRYEEIPNTLVIRNSTKAI